RAGNATDEAPFDAVPTRARRPATAPREPAESPGDLTAPELAASGRDATASQEAAEGPGDLAAPELPASRRDVAARTASGSFRIQLAAVPPGEEQVTFARLKRRLGDALAGLAPRFQAVSTDSGVLVRVQAAGFASADAASAQCARIRAAGGDCFVVAGSG
ncbi:MAG: SPOR domain-containing protein, partial [Alphaproteobacteria bacterium]